MPDAKSVRVSDDEMDELKKWSHADSNSEALRYAVKQVTRPGSRRETYGANALLALSGALILDKVTLSPWIGKLFLVLSMVFIAVQILELILAIQHSPEKS